MVCFHQFLSQCTFLQPKNAKKITKNLYFWCSRLIKVVNVNTTKKQVASAHYDKQHICSSLQLTCAGLVARRRSGLGLLKPTFTGENFICKLNVLVCLQPFRGNSLLKCVLQPEIAKNSPKPILGVQLGHSFLRSSSPMLVMISCMSVPICNHFLARQANSSKITFFKRVPLFCPLVREDASHPEA